jgi:hypothetical protein
MWKQYGRKWQKIKKFQFLEGLDRKVFYQYAVQH